MSGRWASSNRSQRLPSDWAALREATRRRAGGQCQWVGPPYMDGHHPQEDGHHPTKDGHHPKQDGHHPDADGHHRCTNTGTDADHINAGDNHSPSNLQWLCADHHKHKTQAEAREAAAQQRAKLTHPGSRSSHPGLIA